MQALQSQKSDGGPHHSVTSGSLATAAPASYDMEIGDGLYGDHGALVVNLSANKTEIAVVPTIRCSKPLPRNKTFQVTLQLQNNPDHAPRGAGKTNPSALLRCRDKTIGKNSRSLIEKPSHSVHFHLPRAIIDAVADEVGVPRIDATEYQQGAVDADETMQHLASAMLVAVAQPQQANRRFIDYMLRAVVAQLVHVCCRTKIRHELVRGGLAPWQQRRAIDLLTADLDAEVPLAKVAKECRLSTGHFTRAFRASLGKPPHQWLLRRRIEKAKDMMSNTECSLAEVAVACGFADQSHLTRVFARLCGVSPGRWRRHNASGGCSTDPLAF